LGQKHKGCDGFLGNKVLQVINLGRKFFFFLGGGGGIWCCFVLSSRERFCEGV